MKIALLSPINWLYHNPCEKVISLLSEGLIIRGVEVTLFPNSNPETEVSEANPSFSYQNSPSLLKKEFESPSFQKEEFERFKVNKALFDKNHLNYMIRTSLHISGLLEKAREFDLIHNFFDFVPLLYSRLIDAPMVTTTYRFSSESILSILNEYSDQNYYVSTSVADRIPYLQYLSTVYHGIDVQSFTFRKTKGNYLVFCGSIQPGNGTEEAIEIAQKFGMKLILSGIIRNQAFFDKNVVPHLSSNLVSYKGTVDHAIKNTLLGGAYALLHPMRFPEPFDLSIVEAMACGTPVVAFSRGSVQEIIKDCKTGYLSENVEASLEKLKLIPGIDRTQCRRWVEERFSKERMVDDYLSVYNRIIEIERPHAHHANPPWGKWEVLLDEPAYKVKRVTVLPGKRLSYQKHFKREEHWIIVAGKALVTIDGENTTLETGQSIIIHRESSHRVENPGQSPLVFIEIQRGSYLGEDDIVRLEDDFVRP